MNRLCKRISSSWISTGVIWRSHILNPVTTVQIRQRLPFLVLPIVLVWYLISPSAVAAMSLVMLLGLVLTAYFWTIALARGVKANRELRFGAVQIGDEIEEIIRLSNASSFPIQWAEFSDHSNMPGYSVSSVRAASANQTIEWHTHAICTRRGLFLLSPWELSMGDPFGFFLVKQSYLQEEQILVYPSLAALPNYIPPSRQAYGSQHVHHQPLQDQTIDALSTRPYIPGDSRRQIHWPTSARRNELYVRTFDPVADTRIWLIPDIDRRVHLGAGDLSTEETMVLFTASLAFHLLQQGSRVGLFLPAPAQVVIPPRMQSDNIWSILGALASLTLSSEQSLACMLPAVRPLIHNQDQILLITPSLDPAWVYALKELTRARHSVQAEAVLIDPVSFGGVGETDAFRALLISQGISTTIIHHGELRPIHAAYGQLGRWDFISFGTGKVIARQTPHLVKPSAPLLSTRIK